jgi:hypothetical protein
MLKQVLCFRIAKFLLRHVLIVSMQNLPIPFAAIFFQYMLLWKRLSAHYFSTYVLTCLVYGEPIKPIPKLLVSFKLIYHHMQLFVPISYRIFLLYLLIHL